MKWLALGVLIALSVVNVIMAGPFAIPLGILTGVVIFFGWMAPARRRAILGGDR